MSPEKWRALAGKQALDGHPSRWQCSERTPQGPRQGCQTEEPAPSRLGTPFAHHLQREAEDQAKLHESTFGMFKVNLLILILKS